MNICRTCLKTPANKDISQLEKGIKENTKNYVDIMGFCLDIVVTQDSKITMNLCNSCYRKIISFYKFKALSLKNDVYLRSLHSAETLVDQKVSVYVDENGIKHENSMDPDECGPCVVEYCCTDFKKEKEELDVKDEYTEAIEFGQMPLSVEIEIKSEEIKNEIKDNAPVRKKRNRSKKVKPVNVTKVEQKRYVCEECGKSVLNLKEHSLVHQPRSERQLLRCEACPKLFSSANARKKHHKFKHLGVKFECDICHKKVVCLSVHKLRVHDPDALRFRCVQCGRRFISQSALDVHVTSHTKVLAYECDDCHKKFRSKENIIRHVRQVHLKVKLHQCHVCSKEFFQKYYLDNHLRTHTKERPYECEECGKCFATKDTLNRHRPTHSDAKTFRCQLCDKSFLKSSYLKVHMISHTKEKKHPCQFCGVRFGRSDHRRRHEYTAHQKNHTS